MTNRRETLFDFLRSVFMLFAFFHHFYTSFPNTIDYLKFFNPFAELFVGLAGFMVGFVYLHRNKDISLAKRGFKILLAYYITTIPIGIIGSYTGAFKTPVLETIINTITFQSDLTAVGILRFYAIIFIFLPLILTCYRKVPRLTLFASIVVFVLGLFIQEKLRFENLLPLTMIMVLQWQLFFMFGLKLGDLYKKNQLKIKNLILASSVLGPVGIIMQLIWFRDIPVEKFPYSLEKLFNTFYLVPLYLFIIWIIFKKIKGKSVDKFIRVVGRNSLIAFVISDFIRYGLIVGVTRFFNLNFSDLQGALISVFTSVLLILILWIYEKNKSRLKINIFTKPITSNFNINSRG